MAYSVWETYVSVESITSENDRASFRDFMRWFWWSFLILSIAVPASLGFAVFAQRHWARVTLALYFVVEWVLTSLVAVNDNDTASLLRFDVLVYVVVELSIIVLLFTAPSSEWFRAGAKVSGNGL